MTFWVERDWPARLAACLTAAAVEEMRVRLAEQRISQRYRHELSAARRMVPIGGRRR